VKVPKIDLVVANHERIPVAADKFCNKIREAIDDRLLDLMGSGDLPTVTVSVRDANVVVSVEDQDGIFFVNEVLKDLNLSAITQSDFEPLTWFACDVTASFFYRKNMEKYVIKVNNFSELVQFKKGPRQGDMVQLRVGLTVKDIQKLLSKSFAMNCLSFGLVKLHPISD